MKITHDIHAHSILSSCCQDPAMTPATLLRHAQQAGYDTICVTDHYWDEAAPGVDDWYRPQDTAHVRQNLPLPRADGVRFCFGCETEYCGGSRIGITPNRFDSFDFIIVPVNHFHMEGFTRPAEITSPEAIAQLMMSRLEELQRLPLPWRKIGIAHFTCDTTRLGKPLAPVFDAMPELRLSLIFRFFAAHGTGIELNACSFPLSEPAQSLYRPYRIARDVGCRFYFGSDAHTIGRLEIQDNLGPVTEALGLCREQLYTIPD